MPVSSPRQRKPFAEPTPVVGGVVVAASAGVRMGACVDRGGGGGGTGSPLVLRGA